LEQPLRAVPVLLVVVLSLPLVFRFLDWILRDHKPAPQGASDAIRRPPDRQRHR
jgi:hypothetical protein